MLGHHSYAITCKHKCQAYVSLLHFYHWLHGNQVHSVALSKTRAEYNNNFSHHSCSDKEIECMDW